MLTQEQITQYQQQGFVVLDELFDAEQLAAVKARAAKLVDEWVEDSPGHTFTTEDNDRTGDDYFLDSAEKIRCFFEEEAFGADGKLVQERSLCINKIGHALHELDPVFDAFSHQALLGDIARDIGMQQPQIRQSMYIFKQPRIGGVVNWHQDATYFFSTPQSVVTFWFAIEDATLENGCLWVEPAGAQGATARAFQPRWPYHHHGRVGQHPLANGDQWRTGGSESRQPGGLSGYPAPLQRAESFCQITPGLYPARHRRSMRLRPGELAAEPRAAAARIR